MIGITMVALIAFAAAAPEAVPEERSTEVVPEGRPSERAPKTDRSGAADRLAVEARGGWLAPLGALEGSPTAALQVGYLLHRGSALWGLFEVAYARPSVSGTLSTRTLPSGSLDYRLEADDLMLFLGVRKELARLPAFVPAWSWLEPMGLVADVGLRLHLLSVEVRGDALVEGSLGRSRLSSTAPGTAARLGLTYRLGPGRILAMGELGYERIDQKLVGKEEFFTITPSLGYGLTF